jgi:hypothetical protein
MLLGTNEDGRPTKTEKIHGERPARFIHNELAEFSELITNNLVTLWLVDDL